MNRNFDLSDCVEYCIEAGRPDTIDREKLQVLLDHGADRISVNPQSLEDPGCSPPSAGSHSAGGYRKGHGAGHGPWAFPM